MIKTLQINILDGTVLLTKKKLRGNAMEMAF